MGLSGAELPDSVEGSGVLGFQGLAGETMRIIRCKQDDPQSPVLFATRELE